MRYQIDNHITIIELVGYLLYSAMLNDKNGGKPVSYILLIPECFNRIKAGSLPGGEKSKEQTNPNRY